MFTTLLLVGLSTLSPPSSAADEETTASAPLTLESDLHEHYIQGQAILIWLGVRNLSEETQPFPALDGEPWRVQFELTPEGGSKEVRSNVKAEDSEPKTWSISPGRARSTCLGFPRVAPCPQGRYTLQLKVQTESGLSSSPSTD